MACVAENDAPALSRTGAQQPRVLPSWPVIRVACAYHSFAGRHVPSTHVVPSGAATGARRAPPGAAHTQPWRAHGSAPVAWSAMVHPAAGIDALAVAPVRPT